LSSGEFVAPNIPSVVPPGQWAKWRGESSFFLAGVVGDVDYAIDAAGVNVHFFMSSPAVGDLFIKFDLRVVGGGPSDFVFFPIRFALDESVEADPVSGPRLVAVLLENESSDDDDIIVPIPGQSDLPNSRFSIGVRNKKDPVSVRTWLKALGADPQLGLRGAFDKLPSARRLVELPIDFDSVRRS
jgi:hypothetical protein